MQRTLFLALLARQASHLTMKCSEALAGLRHQKIARDQLRSMAEKGWLHFDETKDTVRIHGMGENGFVTINRLRYALSMYGQHKRTCAVSRYSYRVKCDCGLDDFQKA